MKSNVLRFVWQYPGSYMKNLMKRFYMWVSGKYPAGLIKPPEPPIVIDAATQRADIGSVNYSRPGSDRYSDPYGTEFDKQLHSA